MCLRCVHESEADSQTGYISIYTIPYESSFLVRKNIKIIDTPGFGDTRGVKFDKEMVEQIERVFNNENESGVDKVNAVGLLVSASDKRLTEMQKYIFSQVLSIFGKEIAENIIIIVTHAYSSDPGVLQSVKKYGIPTEKTIFVNNIPFICKKNDPIVGDVGHKWMQAASSYREFLSDKGTQGESGSQIFSETGVLSLSS